MMSVTARRLENRFARLRLIGGIAGVLCLIATLAVAASPQPLQAQPSARLRTCLWSVQSGGASLYLLGSVHFLRRSDHPLPEAMEAAYARSSQIVFETDLGSMTDPALQAKMLQLGTYPQGEDIFAHLRPDTRELLEQKLTALGLPAEVIAPLRPWTVALTLSALELKRLAFDEDAGVDLHFFRKAQADGKATAFLESNDFQIDLLAGLDAANQNAFLQQTLKDFDQLGRLAPELVTLWRTGDHRRLHALLTQNFGAHPDLQERFLTQRNRTWARQIHELVGQPKDILIVVGVLHLVGPEGVVELLRGRGLRVRQH